MGKKFTPKETIEDEDLSDLEMDTGDNEDIQIVNEKERLETLTNKIKDDFIKQYKAKGRNTSWLETLTETSLQAIDPNLNTDDDIKRELIFYNITLENTMKALKQVKNVYRH
jgi:hypothetical protein